MQLQEAGQMYLETIYRLEEEYGEVRSIDIANRMGYSKPTISEQMKKFREDGLINMDRRGLVSLTEKGKRIAVKTYDRHVTITKFLSLLGVKAPTSEEDACRIEHYISEETFQCMKRHCKEMAEKKGLDD